METLPIHAHLANEFHDRHLQDSTPVRELICLTAQERHCAIWIMVRQECQSIPASRNILLTAKEVCDHFWGILKQELALWKLVQLIQAQDGVSSDKTVPMFKILQNGRNQGFQDVFLANSTQKSQSDPTNIFIGMLKIIPQILADQDLQSWHPVEVRTQPILSSTHVQAI